MLFNFYIFPISATFNATQHNVNAGHQLFQGFAPYKIIYDFIKGVICDMMSFNLLKACSRGVFSILDNNVLKSLNVKVLFDVCAGYTTLS